MINPSMELRRYAEELQAKIDLFSPGLGVVDLVEEQDSVYQLAAEYDRAIYDAIRVAEKRLIEQWSDRDGLPAMVAQCLRTNNWDDLSV